MSKTTKKSDSNQQMIIDLIREISGQANLITIPRIFINLTGDIKAALFLSQCIYWGDRSSTGDGWFYKLANDWKEDIGLSYHEVIRVRKDLISKNLLEYEIHQVIQNGNEPVGFYRINFENLYQVIGDLIGSREKRETVSRKARDGIAKSAGRSREKREMLNRYLTEPTSELTTEPTSSSYPHPNAKQEEVEEGNREIQISEVLISALEEIDIFESLYGEILASGWTEEQLLELVRRVQKSNCENPGAIFIWRLRNNRPPRKPGTTTLDYMMLRADLPSDDQPEIPDEVYDAWEKTLSQLSLELSKANYLTWVEPIKIARYNGSLVLHVANSVVIDELEKLTLYPHRIREIFSGNIGRIVPIEFEVS